MKKKPDEYWEHILWLGGRVVSGNAKDVGEITFIDGTINACGGYTKILAGTMTPETWQNRIFRAGFLHRHSTWGAQ